MSLPENFTGTTGTELHAYGALWITNGAHTGVFEINANRAVLRGTPSASGCYYYNQQPLSADYDISCTINTTSTISCGGIVGRCDPTASTFYTARWNAGFIQLYKFVAGTSTLLGSGVSQTMTSGQDYTLTLSMSGSTIRVLWDGVQKISVTDTAITAIGYPGIRANSGSTVFYYDNFSVTNMPSASSALIGATTDNAVGSGTAKVSPVSLVSATTANLAAAWVASAGPGSGAIAATTAGVSGYFLAATSTVGTFTSEVLRDYAGNVLANTSLNFVCIYNDTTGALVVRKTGLVTNFSGVFAFSDPVLVAGTTYRVDWETATGTRRMPRKAAA